MDFSEPELLMLETCVNVPEKEYFCIYDTYGLNNIIKQYKYGFLSKLQIPDTIQQDKKRN